MFPCKTVVVPGDGFFLADPFSHFVLNQSVQPKDPAILLVLLFLQCKARGKLIYGNVARSASPLYMTGRKMQKSGIVIFLPDFF